MECCPILPAGFVAAVVLKEYIEFLPRAPAYQEVSCRNVIFKSRWHEENNFCLNRYEAGAKGLKGRSRRVVIAPIYVVLIAGTY